MTDFSNHPCFNAEARHKTGRIHLPVAAKCNVQCNFCNRKFDCANESRPGVSTAVLKPDQAENYLGTILEQAPNIAVVGIAGPGDPFANAAETMETLERVHARYPDKLLCLSSNGLYLAEYIPRLAELNVSHVTITVNAVNPKIGAEIYEWVHYKNKTYFGIEGAQILLSKQTESIFLLKQFGITVKINTVIIPRVNEYHAHEIAEYVAKLGADVQNCIPLIPVKGTAFGGLHTPSPANMRVVRAKASVFIKQMTHCARCRADAVGLLGEDNSTETESLLTHAKKLRSFKRTPYIAASSADGISVNQHLGVANFLWIYGYKNNSVELIEKRPIPKTGDNRWLELANNLSDCHSLLVAGVGRIPLDCLEKSGINTISMEGSIANALEALFNNKKVPESALKISGSCGYGSSCSGSGSGCN
jgi:nitrogen fixation protein NifB